MAENSDSLVKLLIILGGGVHQIPYIKYCRQNNISTLVLDQNKDALGSAHADLFLSVNTSNIPEVISAIEQACCGVQIKGVLVAGVELAVLGSHISKHFHTKSIPIETAIGATNKIIRAQKFEHFAVPAPKFEVVNSIHSVSIDYPFVIKQQEGSGSRGVRIIGTPEDKIAAAEIFVDRGDSQYLVEEFIEGHEISIEAFIHNGEFHYYCYAVRDIETISSGKVIEHGSISDPLHDEAERKAVKKAFEDACLALGIDGGPVKGDVLYNDTGAWVLEVAARSAPLAPLLSGRVYGMDMVATHIKWVLDEDFALIQTPVSFSKAKPVSHKILLHQPGKLTGITGLDEASKSKGVLEFITLRTLQFPMVLDPPDNGNRLFYVAATGVDAPAASRNADDALSKIQLRYE